MIYLSCLSSCINYIKIGPAILRLPALTSSV